MWPICVMRNKIVIDTQERRNKSHVGVTSASRYTALLDYFDLLTADTYQLNSCSCFLKFIVRHWCNRVQCFTQLRARLNNFGVLWVTSNFSQSYSSTKRDLGCQLGATNAGLHKGISVSLQTLGLYFTVALIPNSNNFKTLSALTEMISVRRTEKKKKKLFWCVRLTHQLSPSARQGSTMSL